MQGVTSSQKQDPLGAVGRLGARTMELWADCRAIGRLLVQTLRLARRIEARHVVEQVYLVGNRSLFFVGTIMAFTGAIMVVQACTQLGRIVGDLTVVGPSFLQLIIREFGPTVAALMIAARYGAAVAAELGAMKTTEQIDALRMAGAHPVPYLVGPRVLGGLIAGVPIAAFASMTAFVSGGICANYIFGVGWDTYFRVFLVDPGDVVVGGVKAACFGVAVPLVACFAGMRARGGAPGVGRATTYAVIGASVAVLWLDLVVGVLGYLIFP